MKNLSWKYKSSYLYVVLICLSGGMLYEAIVSNSSVSIVLFLVTVCIRGYVSQRHLELIKEGKITDFLNEDIKG